MESDIIKLKGVNKWFGDLHVLQDVDLSIRRGERVVICGPSGSGKSTLIRCINRLEQHDEGSIVVDGIELNQDTENVAAIRREVGMVFQHFNLFPHLSVLENCALPQIRARGASRDQAEAKAMEDLRRVRIPEQASKFPSQLSGGQQKLLELARVLMVDPKMILLDEPAAGVNPTLLDTLMDRVQLLNARGITFLLIEHNMDLVMRVCSHVIVMAQGRLLAQGTPQQIQEDPRVLDAYLGGAPV